MNHDGIERSSTSVTNDSRFQVRVITYQQPHVGASMTELHIGASIVELNDGVSATVNRQPSTVDIVVYKLLICKLKESNSIA